MSIIFIPRAGTWTTYSYLIDTDNVGDDIANGIERIADEEPTVECHVAGGAWLLQTLGLADTDGTFVGSFPAEQVEALYERCDREHDLLCAANEDVDGGTYEERKLREFMRMLLHCRYHGCGFTWG